MLEGILLPYPLLNGFVPTLLSNTPDPVSEFSRKPLSIRYSCVDLIEPVNVRSILDELYQLPDSLAFSYVLPSTPVNRVSLGIVEPNEYVGVTDAYIFVFGVASATSKEALITPAINLTISDI